VNKVQILVRNGEAAFDPFAFNLDTNYLNAAIHSGESSEKFNRGDWACAETKIDNNWVFVSQIRERGNVSIDATKSIRIRRATSHNSGWFLACHPSNLMPDAQALAD
jgi:hypothetical protein